MGELGVFYPVSLGTNQGLDLPSRSEHCAVEEWNALLRAGLCEPLALMTGTLDLYEQNPDCRIKWNEGLHHLLLRTV